MNVFKRMKDIVTSNVNSVLDRMEDPEKMIDLSIRELEETICRMNTSLAEKRVEMTKVKNELRAIAETEERWAERARQAAGKNMEDMAREAIEERMKAEERASLMNENLEMLKAVLASTESNIEEAKAKLVDLKATSGTLKARARLAKERVELNKSTARTEDADWERRLNELKTKVSRWEEEADIASSESNATAEPSFRDLEKEAAIEKELAAMKAEMAEPKQIENN